MISLFLWLKAKLTSGECACSVFSGKLGLFKFQIYESFDISFGIYWNLREAYDAATLSSEASGCHLTWVAALLILFGSLVII